MTKLFFTVLIITGLTYSQTFEWVFTEPVSFTGNPSYFSEPVTSDTSANIIYSRLLRNKQISSQQYLGDYLIEKRDTDGNYLWKDTVSGIVSINFIKNDKQNNIIVSGAFRDTLKIHNSMLLDGRGFAIGFVFKLDATGEVIWNKIIDVTAEEQNRIEGMTIDPENNIWLTVNNFQNSFVIKLNPDGNETQSFIQQHITTASGIELDNNGNILVTGSTFNNSNTSFNGYNIVPPYTYNMYVVKYSPAGTALWVKFIEDITLQDFSIACDLSGNSYFSGRLFDATTFENIQVNGPNWVYDFFIAKINSDGEFIWVREVPDGPITGDAGKGNSNFLSCVDDTSIFFAGFTRGTINWGNGITTTSATFEENILQLKYSSDGDLIWAKTAGGSGYDGADGVTIDKYGNCIITGHVSANSVFDSISPGGGSNNIFVAKLNPPDFVVPVQLISFTGNFSANGISLSWITSTEKNNYGFGIERSINAADWNAIGFIEGKGTASEEHSYTYIDKDVITGKYFYRLKQIDFNGTASYSNIIEIEINLPIKFYLSQNYPNPFNPATKINYSIPSEGKTAVKLVQLKVYDILGNEIADLINENKSPGIYEVEFSASNLPSGIYFYKLTTGNFIETKKMVVIK